MCSPLLTCLWHPLWLLSLRAAWSQLSSVPTLDCVTGQCTAAQPRGSACWLLQGASCSLAVSLQGYAGVMPYTLDFAENYEAPSTTAAKHADKFATNVHPVRPLPHAPSAPAEELVKRQLLVRVLTISAACKRGLTVLILMLALRGQEAAPAAATGAPRAEGLDLDLTDAAWAWLTDSALLLTLSDGALVVLTLHVEGGSVKRMKVCYASRVRFRHLRPCWLPKDAQKGCGECCWAKRGMHAAAGALPAGVAKCCKAPVNDSVQRADRARGQCPTASRPLQAVTKSSAGHLSRTGGPKPHVRRSSTWRRPTAAGFVQAQDGDADSLVCADRARGQRPTASRHVQAGTGPCVPGLLGRRLPARADQP